MAIRRFRHKLSIFIGFSLSVLFILGLATQLYEFRNESLTVGPDLDVPKMATWQAGQGSQVKPDLKDFKKHSTTARKNVIIMSHGRSGSTFLGDIFNRHPSVFYMYEPLQSAQRVKIKLRRNVSYDGLVEQFLKGIFSCTFDHPQILADIKDYYRDSDHPRVSQAIASPPLCPYRTADPRWDPKLCYPMTSSSLGSACMNNYDLTVIKVLLSRVPENNIKTVITACDLSANVQCKVVFLVRDPRAMVASSRSVGFYKETKEDTKAKQGTKLYSYKQCKRTEENLEFIRNLPDSLRDRIKLQRYEDLAINPLKELSSLYEFTGLTVMESLRAWLNETTQLSRKACNHETDGPLVTCTKDDAWSAANRWRWMVHPYEIDIIERYCSVVMRLLGYRPVDRSYDLLSDVNTPLFSDDFEAKNWFLH